MKYWIFLLLVFAATQMQAQGSIGFKTGLNFAKLDGPSDIDDQGVAIESWDRNTGFHIGVTYTYSISDAFKLRSEALYSRKGGKYKHIGQYYSTFTNTQGSILTTGQGEYLVNISNTYLDLPISAVYKWKKMELSAGFYGSFLAVSSGEGALKYTGSTKLGTTTGQLDLIMDHNYLSDEPAEFTTGSEIIKVSLDGKSYDVAKTQGAYYDHPATETAKLFNRVDYGLVGGLAWYFNSSLYLGLRYQFGLADLTNDEGHYSRARLDNGQRIFRSTLDRNTTLQASVGFSF